MKTMMRNRFFLPLLFVLLVVIGRAPDVRAQSIRIVFIDDPALQTASLLNEEGDGVSRLASMFRELGGEVMSAPLSEPLPDAEVIVLIRPRRPLESDQLARLWLAIENGANLLIALDPSGQARVNSEVQDRGIARLLMEEYGLKLLDGFLVAPTFTNESVRELDTSMLSVRGENVPIGSGAHSIIAPLLDYEIAVTTWGARSLQTGAFGINSRATPLLYTENAYGETNRNIFRDSDAAPLVYESDSDVTGRLYVAGVGENSRLQNRIALITDGDMLVNGYGLARDANNRWLHIGNAIFASRLTAWLMELPEAAYPPLPPDFTYIRVDGDGREWDSSIPTINDRGTDFPNARYNLRGIRAFYNDRSLYVLIETTAPADAASQVGFQFDKDGNGVADTFVVVEQHRIFLQSEGAVGVLAEGRAAFGDSIEVRLPLSFVGTTFTVCLSAPQGVLTGESASADPDCSDGTIQAVEVPQRDLPSTFQTP